MILFSTLLLLLVLLLLLLLLDVLARCFLLFEEGLTGSDAFETPRKKTIENAFFAISTKKNFQPLLHNKHPFIETRARKEF